VVVIINMLVMKLSFAFDANDGRYFHRWWCRRKKSSVRAKKVWGEVLPTALLMKVMIANRKRTIGGVRGLAKAKGKGR